MSEGTVSEAAAPEVLVEVDGLTKHFGSIRAVDGISFTWFQSKDVVRHPLVKRILDAYAAHDPPEQR